MLFELPVSTQPAKYLDVSLTSLGIAVSRVDLELLLKKKPAPTTTTTTNTDAKKDSNASEVPRTVSSMLRSHGADYYSSRALMVMGGGSILYGTWRYFANMRMLESGRFRPAFWGAGALGAAVAGLSGAMGVSLVKDVDEDAGP